METKEFTITDGKWLDCILEDTSTNMYEDVPAHSICYFDEDSNTIVFTENSEESTTCKDFLVKYKELESENLKFG